MFRRKPEPEPEPLDPWWNDHASHWMWGVWQCHHCVSLTGAPLLHLKLAHPEITIPDHIAVYLGDENV